MRNLVVMAICVAMAGTGYCQFEMQESGTTASFRGIDSVGGGVAWASGTGGTVLRTVDGGKHWQHCAVPPDAEKLDFRGVQAFDEKTAIVMSSGKGDLSRLYKTTDGCATWKLVFTNPDKDGFWDAINMSFPPRITVPHEIALKHIHGFLLGDPVDGKFRIFTTKNGGDTWIRRTARKRGPKGEGCQVDEFTASKGEAAFAASNESLKTVGGFYFLFATGGADARIGFNEEFSLDGALCHESTHYAALPIAHESVSSGAFAMGLLWKDEKSGNFPDRIVVVGGDYATPDSTKGNAAYISHFGYAWRTVGTPSTPPHGYRSSVAYDAAAKMWITVGPNGTDVSTDDGKNWRALKPGVDDAAGADRDWNALSLPFVVGPKGRIGVLRAGALGVK